MPADPLTQIHQDLLQLTEEVQILKNLCEALLEAHTLCVHAHHSMEQLDKSYLLKKYYPEGWKWDRDIDNSGG